MPSSQAKPLPIAGDLLPNNNLRGGLSLFGLGPWYFGISRLFQRDPAKEEVSLAREFLAKGTWAEYAQVSLSSNELAFVDWRLQKLGNYGGFHVAVVAHEVLEDFEQILQGLFAIDEVAGGDVAAGDSL